MAQVRCGLDILARESFSRLKGRRVGLLAHAASVDAHLHHALDLLLSAGIDVPLLLGPEHGFSGVAQDMEPVGSSGPAVLSLYGDDESSLRPSADDLSGLDVVVVDLQDVGARYYTYAATVAYVMEAAARASVSVVILDRPNPLGGRGADLEGPILSERFRSFVGELTVPIRHGLTLGELAVMTKDERGLDLELEVVRMEGWSRQSFFDDTGVPWVQPSPNMPTLDTATVYPGQCLFEGTQMSEGRGTTRPFELVGAPWVDPEAWRRAATPLVSDGVRLRPTEFKPMFQKFGGQTCRGLQLHVVDRDRFRSVRSAAALLWSVGGEASFAWRTEPYEFVSDRLAIDLLFGTDEIRSMIEARVSFDEIAVRLDQEVDAFAEARQAWLLYPDQ